MYVVFKLLNISYSISMQEVKVKDIIQVTKGKLISGNLESTCENYNIDTRLIKSGEIFVGMLGENVNGGIFFEEAFEKGAKGCIVQNVQISEEQKSKYKDKIIIEVEDTVKAIKQIASFKRKAYNIPVIGITGSVGKTSTKDIVANVVAQKYNTLKTEGNKNGQLGVPLTILKLKDEEALVLEMGMSHAGEMRELTNIAKPTIVAINNIGTAHIGNLGSRENILKAKLEILEGMPEEKIIVVNNDNDILHEWQKENKHLYNIITFGIENESDYMAQNIITNENGSKYTLVEKSNNINEEINNTRKEINGETNKKSKEIEVPVAGNHFILNSLCAIAIGRILGVEINKIAQGIKTFELTKNRMNIINKGTVTIINDTYNANYDSVKAAIEYLSSRQEKRKIAVLGDMLELGEYSKQLHEKVGEEIVKNKIDMLITVGEEAKNIAKIVQENNIKVQAESSKVPLNFIETIECNKNEEAIQKLKREIKQGDCILVKASNSMHFNEIVNEIINI